MGAAPIAAPRRGPHTFPTQALQCQGCCSREFRHRGIQQSRLWARWFLERKCCLVQHRRLLDKWQARLPTP